ncbi:MFS transporter [Xanthomonas campestris pv. lawsoniae]|uniref:MFS transporter n=1 Tax=Xanthomonas euvesicatoria TaxID=456327 RepID=UPI001C47F49A|nr:MFS transporter [Xanthomonas euvesicatoria]MBV6802788.1 MFS transporter [Xanthomonas campestris pv. lawsoniae]
MLIGSIALLILGVQPILLGTLVEQKLITLSGVGIVAMGEIVALGLGLGLGVALGDALLPHRWQRQVAVLAALLAALLDLATTQAVGDTAFVLVRAAAGLAEGLLLWVATLTIVRAAKPDRVTAVFMLTQAVAQIALANLLALWVLPSTGWKGGFVALGAVTLCAALLTPLLPATLSAVSATAPASRVRWSPTTLLPLLIAFVQMAATGALWAYLEPLGLRAGLDAGAVQAHTSLVLAMQIVGALAAIWWVRRLGHARTLVVGSLVLAAVAAIMARAAPAGTAAFTVACVGFGLVWMFLMPFHVGLAFGADAHGRVAVLVPAVQLLGSAAGPLLASLLLQHDDPAPVPAFSLAAALLAAVLAAAAGRDQRRRAPAGAQQNRGDR